MQINECISLLCYVMLVCVTDQETWTYPNLCGLWKSSASEILRWLLGLWYADKISVTLKAKPHRLTQLRVSPCFTLLMSDISSNHICWIAEDDLWPLMGSLQKVDHTPWASGPYHPSYGSMRRSTSECLSGHTHTLTNKQAKSVFLLVR